MNNLLSPLLPRSVIYDFWFGRSQLGKVLPHWVQYQQLTSKISMENILYIIKYRCIDDEMLR